MLRLMWTLLLTLLGATIGAIWLGDFTSIPMSLLGAALGGVVGWLMGKYIPIYEWFI